MVVRQILCLKKSRGEEIEKSWDVFPIISHNKIRHWKSISNDYNLFIKEPIYLHIIYYLYFIFYTTTILKINKQYQFFKSTYFTWEQHSKNNKIHQYQNFWHCLFRLGCIVRENCFLGPLVPKSKTYNFAGRWSKKFCQHSSVRRRTEGRWEKSNCCYPSTTIGTLKSRKKCNFWMQLHNST